MEYTQEQIDALIADAVKEAKKGLFTEEELNKKVTAEVDRRVESGIQKGLETQKAKWEEEFSKKANLSAEELAQQKLEEQMKSINMKESELNKKANELSALEMLTQASIPKSHYEKFVNILVNDNAEATTANIQSFIDMFNSTKQDIETTVRTELSKVKPPELPTGGEGLTKDTFKTLGYAQKMELKQKSPEIFAEFIKE